MALIAFSSSLTFVGMCCYIVVACEEKTSGSCCQRILSSAGPEEFIQLTGVSTLKGRGRSTSLGDLILTWDTKIAFISITCSEGVFLSSSSLLGLRSRKRHVGENATVLYGFFGR